MREVVLVSAVRTPIGRIRGALSGIRPDDLAAQVITSVLRRIGLPGDEVDEVVLGCANQAGEDNRNVARMATLLAGLPHSVPAMTLNRLCASGLSAVNTAARTIACGDAEVIVAGGVESMSRAPWVMPKADGPFPSGNVTVFDSALGWRFPNPAMEKLFPLEAMGETAENLVERYNLSREAQDEYALSSHRRALEAQATGAFDAELMPVELVQKKGPPLVVSKDEGPRADTSLEKLAKLAPVFDRSGKGTLTAGNSSALTDGASLVCLMSESEARRQGRDHQHHRRRRYVRDRCGEGCLARCRAAGGGGGDDGAAGRPAGLARARCRRWLCRRGEECAGGPRPWPRHHEDLGASS